MSSLASHETNGSRFVSGRSTLLIPFALGCAILADRAQVGIATGGRGTLPLLAIMAPAVALATVVRYGSGRSLGFLATPAFVLGVLPYLSLTALLPVLGVMFNGFPERTLLSLTEATTALSFLVIGAALSRGHGGSWSRWLFVAVTIQLLYASGQAAYYSQAPGWELLTPFHEWDLSQQDPLTLVQGRSSGLYLNPNVLGFWAGLAVIVSWSTMSPRYRWMGVSLGVLTLLLSQSRGAAAGVLAALVGGAVLSISGSGLSARTFKGIASFAVAITAALAVAALIVPAALLGDRFGALFDVWSEGPRAEPNLAARLDLWEAVIALNSVYPWGTWGSPEYVLGNAVDNAWFRLFAQGSVLFVATLAMLLVAAFSVSRHTHGVALPAVTIFIAVAGLTQTPFGYPAIVLFWLFLGGGLQASVVRVPSGLDEAGVAGIHMSRGHAAPTRAARGPGSLRPGIPND